ncbi:leucyl-trna synthetase [Holotrichia oblita]|nr:leucyl-trna synthetase [Holotrichia oblita]
MSKYDFAAIEKKWQDYWYSNKTFSVKLDKSKPKFYALIEFPYPSAQGLHAGHPRPYTAMDIISRKRRMQGYNVLLPMGWDAFGLPTENFAIKNKIHPAIITADNINKFTEQCKGFGYSFDWEREVNTTDPDYYRWTQWIFLQLFKNGLAYKKEMPVNWCTDCKVVLANEEVIQGTCERCHGPVVQKVKSQWMLKITEYADRLINDLADVDFIERVKTSEINWIGRSEGAEVDFAVCLDGAENLTDDLSDNLIDNLKVYTTRPDTLFGATYMVIAPEHPLVEKWADKLNNITEIREYVKKSARKSDFERSEMVKEKTGVMLDGISAVNPVNGNKIPVFISDYVLMSYGTGAIMAVPGHDTRDWEFAKVFNLPIIEVVKGGDIIKEAFTDCETGMMVNSGFLDGFSVEEAKESIKKWLEENKKGERSVKYKLRDWVFSRQRYWGEPIPLVYCDICGWVPVPEEELPLKLPHVENYMPTDTGESPLSTLESFINTECPKCGAPARRETDVMPQWAGSSWYFLRYCDPNNDKELISKEALEYWMPVDWYNGGMEHATLHLLYSRFWHKFLFDIGIVNTPEPYMKRTAHGMILGEDGQKMSKSIGNVVNPNEIVAEYGADSMRLYEMFIGDFEKTATWNTASIKGCKRFLDRIWALQDILEDDSEYGSELKTKMHCTIKKVSEDIEAMKFNTAIAAMMTLINDIYAVGSINRAELRDLIIILSPFAPHIAEEMYESLNLGSGKLNGQKWVEFDPALCISDTIEIVVQINGDYIKNIIDVITEGNQSVPYTQIITGIVIVIAGVCFTYLQSYCSGFFSVHICTDLRKRIANKMQSFSFNTIQEKHSGDIISKINHDLPIVQGFFSETIPSFVYSPVVLIGTSIYLALIDWRLLLITTCLIPLTIFISSKFGKPVKKYAKAMSECSANETATAKDIINGIYVSKAFNLQNTVYKKYENATDKLIENYYLYEKKLAVLTPFNMIIRLVPFFFCFIFGGYFAVNGWISTGSLYAFIFLLNNLIHPMSEIPYLISGYRTFDVSLIRIEELLNEPEERKDGNIYECNNDIAVEFNDVCFYYNNEKNVHENLSFRIQKGKFIAIVGTSGCGKTTVLKEICGFCNPQSGSILIYGKDIEQWNLDSIRKNIALISQDSFLYPTTIMENISYGKTNASIDDIYKSAKSANAHEFIMKLPNGYNTMVGEKGIRLSGGQKQRICIARAILKDAKILLMDEPTSSLDANSETLIEEAILTNKDERTIILVAHRFSTIKSADLILVMDKGHIIEEGTYKELLEKEGMFKKLYKNQCLISEMESGFDE